MKKFIFLLIATLTVVINGRRIYNPDDTDSCEIFELHDFIESTELDIGNIDEVYNDQSIIRIYKDTSLIFPTTEGFKRRTLPSKFTIEFVYELQFEPSCKWNLISIADCEQNELFIVSLDPEDKLVTVSFTDQYGNCVKSTFIDYNMSLTCRREMVIEVTSNKITVYIDHKTLRCEESDLSSDRELIDLSNTETKLVRQENFSYSIEMDIERFVILTDTSPIIFPRFEVDPYYPRPGLKGEIGQKGSIGDRGLKGDKGNCGPAGADGKDGEIGERCDRQFPVDGFKGAPGDNGAKGLKGLKGADGSKGADGTPGTNGKDGHNGSAGAAGGSGPKGEKGEYGLIGNSIAGNPGEKGAKGEPLTRDQVIAIVKAIAFSDVQYEYRAEAWQD